MSTEKISSFAAPTDADIATFEAMSDAEKRELVKRELDKGMEGEPQPWTAERRDSISARVAERLKAHVPG